MLNINFEFSGFEEALEEAINEGVQGVMCDMEATARQVSCPEHGKASSIYFDQLEPRPEHFFVKPCCDRGKDLVYQVLGITERSDSNEITTEEGNMKQSEKLDTLMRGFYEHRDEVQYTDGEKILQAYGIEVSAPELDRLKERLRHDGLIDGPNVIGHLIGRITSRGVEYSEENSYSYVGRSLLSIDQSVTINGGSGVSVIAHSTNSSIHSGSEDGLMAAIAALETAIASNAEITNEMRTELMESVGEVKELQSKGMKPKGAIKHIMEAAKNAETIVWAASAVYSLFN